MNRPILDVFFRGFLAALIGLFALEAVSFFGFLHPWFSSTAFVVIVLLAAVLAVKDPPIAMVMLFAELFTGSQGGYLVAYGTESGLALSLRIGLFMAVFGAWAAVNVAAIFRPALREKAWGWFGAMKRTGVLWPYVALMLAFMMAAVRGVVGGNELANVFFDANGYAYFALIPAVVSVIVSREVVARIGGTLAASVIVSVSKALFVEFLFSHRMFRMAKIVYVWVRDTRVGEITIMGADFYRVFFQSQVWLLFVSFPLLLMLMYVRSWRDKRSWAIFGLLTLAAASMLLSLSRSFWFGAGVTVIGSLTLLAWMRPQAIVWVRGAMAGVGAVVAGFALIAGLYAFPYPSKTGDFDFASFLGGRAFTVSGEAAANSRWALLPILNAGIAQHPLLGSGFGTTLTYTTSDPRLLADNPMGEYKTFAFEWGYHDLVFKLGVLGMLLYGWFLFSLLRPLVYAVRKERRMFLAPASSDDEKQLRSLLTLGVLAGTVAMLVTNVFSPYLNHPLGIGMLALVMAIGASDMIDRKS